MKNSIKTELANYIIDLINDGVLHNDNKEDWLYHAFNEDYYIIGYHNASEWLKRHDIDPFEAIRICQQYEKDKYSESRSYDNSESTVNMLAYIYGEQLIYSEDFETVEELEKYMLQF